MECKELEAKVLESQQKRDELKLEAQKQQTKAEERARRVHEFTEPYQALRDRNRNLTHTTQTLIDHVDTNTLLVKLKGLEDNSSIYAFVLFAGPHGLPFAKIDFFESLKSTEELREAQANGKPMYDDVLHTDKTYEIYAKYDDYDNIQRSAEQHFDASTFLTRKRFRRQHMQQITNQLDGFQQSLRLVTEAIDDPALNPELAMIFEDKPAWTFLPANNRMGVEA